MKVLFLARRFYPDIGGVETHVCEVGKILVKKGHEVTVITQSLGIENEIDGIKIIRIPETPKNKSEKIFIWKWFWENRNLIEKSKIIHVHDVYFWYFPFRFIYPKKFSFITFHGFENFPIRKKEIIIRKLSEKLADGNIVVGDFIKKWYKTNSDFVTYGGVNIPEKIIKAKNINSGVFIGRLDRDTNILDFAKTIQLLKNRGIKFKFIIVGDGKLKELLSKDFKIFKETREISKYLDQANFVFSSSYLSILNAFANKRMVFSLYDNDLKKDYLKMSPLFKNIVIADSPERLVDKINYFLDFPKDIEKYKKSGFKYAKKNTWGSVVEIYLKLWRRNK